MSRWQAGGILALISGLAMVISGILSAELLVSTGGKIRGVSITLSPRCRAAFPNDSPWVIGTLASYHLVAWLVVLRWHDRVCRRAFAPVALATLAVTLAANPKAWIPAAAASWDDGLFALDVRLVLMPIAIFAMACALRTLSAQRVRRQYAHAHAHMGVGVGGGAGRACPSHAGG